MKLKVFQVQEDLLVNCIYQIRDKKVMIDEDLAMLYQVETKRINEQVKRNLERFPDDFAFYLTQQEYENLKSQFATSSWGGRRKPPLVFTELGIAMLSSVLNSPYAIQVNIAIMRVFTKMRNTISDLDKLKSQLNELVQQSQDHSENIELIFQLIHNLGNHENKEIERPSIGFKLNNK